MQNLAFTHLNVFDGRLGSDLQEDVTILVDLTERGKTTEGTITDIRPASETEIPADYREIDLAGKYVIPGLINAHAHLFGDGKPRALMSAPESVMVFFVRVMNSRLGRAYVTSLMRRNAQTALNAGVTTLRAAGFIVKLILAAIAVLLILDNIPGVEITALVASLGITGIPSRWPYRTSFLIFLHPFPSCWTNRS